MYIYFFICKHIKIVIIFINNKNIKMEEYSFSKKQEILVRVICIILLIFIINLIIMQVINNNTFFLILLILFNLFLAFYWYDKMIFFILIQMPLFPLLIPAEYNSYTSPGTEIIVLLYISMFLFKTIISKKLKLKKTSIDLPLFIFILISTISIIITIKNSLNINFIETFIILANLHPLYNFDYIYSFYPFRIYLQIFEGALLFFTIVNIIDVKVLKQKIKIVFYTILGMLLPLILYGYYQLIFDNNSYLFIGMNRVYSLMINPNPFGFFLISLIPICFSYIFIFGSYKKIIPIILFILSLIILFFTFSRGAWLGLTVAFLSAILIITKKNKKYKYLKIILIILPIILLILAMILFNYNPSMNKLLKSNIYLSHLLTPLDFDKSIQYRTAGRWYIWLAAINAFKENPIFGIGLGKFYEDMSNYYPPDIIPWTYHQNAHNYFLQIGAELGLAGLLPLVIAFFLTLKYGIKGYLKISGKDEKILLLGLFGGLIAELTHSMVNDGLLTPKILFTFWFIVALIHIISSNQKVDKKFIKQSKT